MQHGRLGEVLGLERHVAGEGCGCQKGEWGRETEAGAGMVACRVGSVLASAERSKEEGKKK